jgi:hypothetical protein
MNKELMRRKHEERKTLAIGSMIPVMVHDRRFNFLYSQGLISASAFTVTSEPVLAP